MIIKKKQKVIEKLNICDAIDINFGCPQIIAKRNLQGAFLLDEPERCRDIVKVLSSNLSIPVTAKIRVFEDEERTIQFCKMLEEAGASCITGEIKGYIYYYYYFFFSKYMEELAIKSGKKLELHHGN